MLSNPLSNLLISEEAGLQQLARAWKASGASAIGITIDNVSRVIWSDAPSASTATPMPTPVLRDAVTHGARTLGEVWVTGIEDQNARARLCADANWLAALAQREAELEDLTHELVEAQDQLLALYELNRSRRAHTTTQGVLEDLAAQTARMMKSAYAFAVLVKRNATPITVQYPQEFGFVREMQALAMQSDQAGEALVLQDSGNLLGGIHVMGQRAHNALVMSTRLSSGELVALGWCNRYLGGFGSPEIKLASALVEQAGGYIEGVLQHEAILAQVRVNTELELARAMQERLLPGRSLQLPQLDIAASTIPALEMGGDFYDYAVVPNRPLMFCVGDVSGKGLAAASVMSAARTAIRTHSRYMHEPSPAAVLNRTNEDLETDLNAAGKFITAFVGHYQPETSQLRYANAGHSPVLFKRVGEATTMLEAEAPPIGVWSLLDCADVPLTLQPGDVLAIASDGLPEAASATGDLFGYGRLIAAFDRWAEEPSSVIVENLLKTVHAFSAGVPQADDQTLLVIKRTTD